MGGFVVIAEADEVNRERIRAILETVERKFDYELVGTAEQAINLVASRKPEVFVGDMKMPVMSGSELFSTVQIISPDTIRVVLVDAAHEEEVVSFMNACKTFKIILKPCRVADDIVTPIEASLEYYNMKSRMAQEMDEANVGAFSTKEDYLRMQQTWQENLDDYERAQHVFAELLMCNVELGNFSDDIKIALKSRFTWMMKEYVQDILDSTGDYETCRDFLIKEGERHDAGCLLQINNVSKEKIKPDQMKKITYIVQLFRRACGEILYHYEMSVKIEAAEKAYVLRMKCTLDEAPSDQNRDSLFREKNSQVREVLTKATELAIDAFGFKTVVLNKEKDVFINIAIPR